MNMEIVKFRMQIWEIEWDYRTNNFPWYIPNKKNKFW